MKVVDARSGAVMQVGQTINYPDGESVTLLAVKPGLFRASAQVRMVYSDPMTRAAGGQTKMVDQTVWAPLTVRWFHPGFPFQHVGFINS